MTTIEPNSILKNKNILFVLKDLDNKKNVLYVKELSLFLRTEGIKPTIISSGGEFITEFTRHGLHHITAPVDKTGFFNERTKVKIIEKICENENIDILHNFSRTTARAAFKVHISKKLPLISNFNRIYYKRFGSKRLNSRLINSDFTIIPSNYIRDIVIERYKNFIKNKNNILVVNNWVDTFLFSKTNASAVRIEDVIQRTNLPEDKKIILIPEDIEKSSGLKNILMTIKKCKEKGNFIALILGEIKDPKYLHTLQKTIKEENLEEYVKISSNTENFLEYLAVSNLAIFPSKIKRGSNDNILKAQSMGVPVIVNDKGVNEELIEEGKTGFIINDKNIYDMVLAIDNIITLSEQDHRRFSMESLKLAKVSFDYKSKCAEIANIYEKALKRYKRR